MINKALLRKAIFAGVFGAPSPEVLARINDMTEEAINQKLDMWKPKRLAHLEAQISKLTAEKALVEPIGE